MNYWQNKKQSGHKDTRHTNAPHDSAPHTNVPTSRHHNKFFKNYKTTPKNMTSIRSKKHIRYQPRTPTPHQKKGVPVHCHNIPFHQYTSSQHNTQLCLKRIEQSTLLSSQTTHHTNNNTIRVIISRSVISSLHFEWQPKQLYSLSSRNTR